MLATFASSAEVESEFGLVEMLVSRRKSNTTEEHIRTKA